MMVGLIIVSGYTSINAVVKAELFPARIRALGVGLPYALTVAIFGGTTEYVALRLKNIGHESWFFFYVAGCALDFAAGLRVHGRVVATVASGEGDCSNVREPMRVPSPGLGFGKDQRHASASRRG